MRDPNKITPGPWSWWTSNSFMRLTGADGKDGGVLSASADGFRFATITVSKADARLIAAAPELLAALWALFNDYKALADSGDAGFWKLEDEEVGKQAMAALNKATGEAP